MPLKESEINAAPLQEVADGLCRSLQASRVTVRLNVPELHPYYPVFGEATGPGVEELRDEVQNHTEMPETPTYQYMIREKKLLVQEDVTTSMPAAPGLLKYGIRAQVLAPILRDDLIDGMLSVHQSDGPHSWSKADLKVIRDAAARVHRELGFEVPEMYR